MNFWSPHAKEEEEEKEEDGKNADPKPENRSSRVVREFWDCLV